MKWTISRSVARLFKWHVQARTEDQMSSFTVIVGDSAHYLRSKTSDGKQDVFTLTDPLTMATMNVVGQIRYVQDWEGIA